MTEQTTTPTIDTDALLAAVAHMAAAVGDREVGADAGTSMTCTEAESIADVMRAAGHADAAAAFLAGHAEADDEGDDHWTDPATGPECRAMLGNGTVQCGADRHGDSTHCLTHQHLA